MKNKRLISIIICTHNRALVLTDALQSLEKVKIPEGFAVDIILIDNASSDGTSLLIETFGKETDKFQIQHMHEENLGKSFALNKGIHTAAGDWLAFIDDDHIVNKGYLDAVSKAVNENPSYNLFCGRILPNWDGTEPLWVHDTVVYPIRPFPIPCFDLGDNAVEIKLGETFIPGAGNLIIRKSVFQNVGLFSEELGPKGHNISGGEDIEFIKRALKSGERLLYVPEVLQYHHVDKSRLALPYLIKKAYLRSMTSYQFSDSNPNSGDLPFYLFRQAFSRLLRALFTFNRDARRYYLVRLAASIGEIQGRRRAKSI